MPEFKVKYIGTVNAENARAVVPPQAGAAVGAPSDPMMEPHREILSEDWDQLTGEDRRLAEAKMIDRIATIKSQLDVCAADWRQLNVQRSRDYRLVNFDAIKLHAERLCRELQELVRLIESFKKFEL